MDVPLPCSHCLASASGPFQLPMHAIEDEEGARLPPDLPPVIDAHVHLFPDRLFDALWRWFDEHAWPVRYRLYAQQVIDFQLSRGVERIVALHYAHKPGLAREMNRWLAAVCAADARVLGVATVYPGEHDAVRILEDGFAAGLVGVKMHCHVQCFPPDAPEMGPIYEACARAGRAIVVHAGREPKSPAYHCDPYELCAVERVENVLRDHPTLKLVVPHLGADEYEGYLDLIERYDNLWLDTTMAMADFFPGRPPRRLLEARPDRILYGTDFPNLPYAWDRELRVLLDRLRPDTLEAVLGGNARALFTR